MRIDFFRGSKKIKSINEDFKNSLYSFDRSKKALRTSMQSWYIMSQVRIHTFNGVSMTFIVGRDPVELAQRAKY